MRRSQNRRASTWFSGRRRIVAAVATLVAFGGFVTVSQVSEAGTRRQTQRALAACNRLTAPETPRSKLSTETRPGTWTTNRGKVTHHADDGSGKTLSTEQMRRNCRTAVMRRVSQTNAGQQQGTNAGEQQGGQQQGDQQQGGQQQGDQQQGGQQQGDQQQGDQQQGDQQQGDQQQGEQGGQNGGQEQGGNNDGDNNNDGNNGDNAPGAGLGVLANNCNGSQLQPHDGFQNGNRCVSTSFGEVGAAGNNASLLITESPEAVQVDQAFEIKVSTRNLIRDRFLAAGQGGYYVESSLLQNGIVRGHFHTACRMLQNTNEAPDPAPVPAFFVATEDGNGGAAPDTVTIQVAGLPDEGLAQCAVWAGDGSHRIPMMERANQTPAFDAVRIQVGNNNNNNNDNNNQGQDNNDQGQQGQDNDNQDGQGQNGQGQDGQGQDGQGQGQNGQNDNN
jgi:hypothetical protein